METTAKTNKVLVIGLLVGFAALALQAHQTALMKAQTAGQKPGGCG